MAAAASRVGGPARASRPWAANTRPPARPRLTGCLPKSAFMCGAAHTGQPQPTATSWFAFVRLRALGQAQMGLSGVGGCRPLQESRLRPSALGRVSAAAAVAAAIGCERHAEHAPPHNADAKWATNGSLLRVWQADHTMCVWLGGRSGGLRSCQGRCGRLASSCIICVRPQERPCVERTASRSLHLVGVLLGTSIARRRPAESPQAKSNQSAEARAKRR